MPLIFQALTQMASENNGTIVCPRTRQTYNIKDAEKVYVMWEVEARMGACKDRMIKVKFVVL